MSRKAYAGGAAPFEATGGTITEVDGYVIHTFTSGGTFTITKGSGTVEYLVVGGGGGGAGMNYWTNNYGGNGGGGGGGYNAGTMQASQGESFSVTIGAGGAYGYFNGWGADARGSNGNQSSLGSIIAGPGGGGGWGHYSGGNVSGITNGGSGGGGGGGGDNASGGSAPGGGGAGGGSGSYGNNGGGGYYELSIGGGGGGGGGAGAKGTDSYAFSNVAGGAGIVNSISGTAIEYSKGGQGAGGDPIVTGAHGAANTGNGGGGGEERRGGNGGSGVVIVRYRKR